METEFADVMEQLGYKWNQRGTASRDAESSEDSAIGPKTREAVIMSNRVEINEQMASEREAFDA